MLKIDRNFFDVIDVANDLLGLPSDRDSVHREYERAILDLITYLTLGGDGKEYIAQLLSVDESSL